MKHSMKKKFAFTFIGLMAGTLFVCWLINNTFLTGYYERKRENAVKETYRILNEAAITGTLGTEEFSIELEKISGRYNIMGVVQEINGLIVGTFGNDMTMMQRLLWERMTAPVQDTRLLEQTGTYTIQRLMDPKTKTEYMEMVGWLDGGEVFYMRTPLENIRESVEIANRFLLYVGIGGVLVSSIVIWMVSKKVTEPILELAAISERMTRLDFEAKYRGKSKDETALLGDNINKLSAALEETIGELKTVNNELQKDLENRNRTDEMRKEFLSNVSHELKTPLALIQGYAEGLKEGINEDEESRNYYCDVIMDEAGKMNNLVKRLLTLNELEFGNDVVNMERFDLVALIGNYIQSAQILTKQQGISVRMEQYEPIYVWADEFKVEEVFMNYFSNALNYCEGEKIIDIRLAQADNKVRVTVFNTGKPIPEESMEHIWEKFYKADKARTREYGGSGVGLSIVKAIMEAFHQSYGVQNFENGVAFWFELETVGKEKA